MKRQQGLKWLAISTTAFGLSVGAVAGCANATQNANRTDTGNAGAPRTTQNIPRGQSITVWSFQGGPMATAAKKLALAWAKQHGDTVSFVDQSKNPNGFQFYATAARTGKGPDVVFGMPHDNNGTFQAEGLMSPVPAGTINPSDYTTSEINACTIQGQLYSLPVSVQTSALFYNTSKVKTPPKTWNDFVKDANRAGFGYDQANLYFNYAFIGGLGGYVFKNNKGTLDPNNIGLDNPGAVKAYQLMRNMVAKYHWMTPSTTGAIAKAQFITGKIGMYISGPWDIPDIQKAKVPYSITPLPKLSNGHSATPFMGVLTTFVNGRSKTQAADWSLATALSNKNAQATYFKVNQQIPTLVSLQQSKTIQSNAYFRAFANEVQYAVPMPNIPQMQAVWSAMSVIGNIIAGKVTPAVGAQDFVKNIKKGIQVQGQ
ncbi:MAG: maltose ABC transporter substrate-binding protein [Alicyclobacillus sp.]|nr:maltose ABC transporter substrate-binding protein [Alicyclobacillus sp.]